MKLRTIGTTAAALALTTVCGVANAVPALQLGISGGTYDTATQTIIAPGPTFTLYAFLTPQGNPTQADIDALLAMNYYISAAVVPKTGPTDATLGSFVFGADTVTATDDMTYGTPPLETVATQLGDPGDLADHGIFETFFSQFLINFSAANTVSELNTQDDPDLSGLNIGGTGMYYVAVTVDTSLFTGTALHFDLYNQKVVDCGNNPNCVAGDIDIDDFAPFSHDAQTGSSSSTSTSTSGDVPEPASSTLVGLGLGLLGIGFMRRRKNAA